MGSQSGDVLALGLSVDDRRSLEALLGLTVAEADTTEVVGSTGEAGRRRVIVFRSMSREDMEAVFRAGGHLHVEWSDAETVADIIGRAGSDLAISATTPCAYRALNGRVIASLMVARRLIEEDLAHGVAEAIQEALANSVIHGNLGMPQSKAKDVDEFAEFHREVSHRLAAAEAERRRISISLVASDDHVTVKVGDEGAGFELWRLAAADPTRATGRGLSMMRKRAEAIGHEDGGRVVALTFRRSGPTAQPS